MKTLKEAVKEVEKTFNDEMSKVETIGEEEAWERMQAVRDALAELDEYADRKE